MPRLDRPPLYCVARGSGRPLVTVHGGPGLDHTYFRPWLDPLAEKIELIYYDQRGNGRSERPDDWSEVDHDTWADDVDRLCDALGRERIVLLGHSYGGYIALEYAVREAHRLAGLVLCSTAPAMDYPEVVRDNLRRYGTGEQEQALIRAMSGEVRTDDEMARSWRTLLPLYFRDYDDEVGRRLDDRTTYSGEAFRRAFTECLPGYDVTDRLSDIDVPTLVLVGRHDWITPPEQGARRLHEGIPDSELVVFEESGHFPFIEEPRRFRRSLLEWMDEALEDR